MEQKTKLMRSLLIGISISIFLFTNCIRKVDYMVRAKWIYINETGHNITYSPDVFKDFNVAPYDTTIYFEDGDGPKNMVAKDYIPPLDATVIFFDNLKCDTLKGRSPNLTKGPLSNANYESKKISNNNLEFTYRFTEKQYMDAKECK